MNLQPLPLLIWCVLAGAGFHSPTWAQSTARVSVDSAGMQGNGETSYCQVSISRGGRFVAFASDATNLVPGDTNGYMDVFVHDSQTGQTRRISVDSAGVEANNSSNHPRISDDGRSIAFDSYASNLVPGDTNGRQDVFVHDLLTSQTTRVSVNTGNAQGDGGSTLPSISANGSRVAFYSSAFNLVAGDTNMALDVFVHDRQTGQTVRVSVDSSGVQGDDGSTQSCISADGSTVAFNSYATNLVPGDTNGGPDVFVHSLPTGITTRVSVDSVGAQVGGGSLAPSLSADGMVVTFISFATNLVPGDTNNRSDIFVHERQTGQTTRVSVDSAGVQGDGFCLVASISADGRTVAFDSGSWYLVPGDLNHAGDVFIHDRLTAQTSRVSLDSAGAEADFGGELSAISSDGRYVAFYSYSTNLVPGDTNGVADVFVRDRGAAGPSLTKSGNCPGAIALTVSNATALGQVAFIHGPTGMFVKPAPPCQGLILGIAPPTVGAIASANGSGTAVLGFNAPPGLCGRSVQAVDVTTCAATNVMVL